MATWVYKDGNYKLTGNRNITLSVYVDNPLFDDDANIVLDDYEEMYTSASFRVPLTFFKNAELYFVLNSRKFNAKSLHEAAGIATALMESKLQELNDETDTLQRKTASVFDKYIFDKYNRRLSNRNGDMYASVDILIPIVDGFNVTASNLVRRGDLIELSYPVGYNDHDESYHQAVLNTWNILKSATYLTYSNITSSIKSALAAIQD